MSTLSLADLGPKMRRELGLEIPCDCETSQHGFVVSIPVIEAGNPRTSESASNDLPGAVWLKTGLHRLRVLPGAATAPESGRW